jgi:hypothetical protein
MVAFNDMLASTSGISEKNQAILIEVFDGKTADYASRSPNDYSVSKSGGKATVQLYFEYRGIIRRCG